jgi:signal transduction histidine kinase
MLQRTNKKLAQAYKTVSLGALTGHLMHALKTPLTHLQIITREAESEKDIDPKELQSVQIQIKDLVTQTLNSLKEIEEQKKYFQITIKEILNSVIERTIKKFPHCNILLSNDPSLETKLDNLQSALLLPILTTLTENAFESKDQTSVKLGSTLDGEKVIIIVSDTSGGISTREKEFLFDPSKSQKRGGTGLGLAIAQQLAQSMDAKLMLKKTDTNGSTFTVSFKC